MSVPNIVGVDLPAEEEDLHSLPWCRNQTGGVTPPVVSSSRRTSEPPEKKKPPGELGPLD